MQMFNVKAQLISWKQTDGQTEAIALPDLLIWSVTTTSCSCNEDASPPPQIAPIPGGIWAPHGSCVGATTMGTNFWVGGTIKLLVPSNFQQ